MIIDFDYITELYKVYNFDIFVIIILYLFNIFKFFQ